MAFPGRWHKLNLRKLNIKGEEATPFLIENQSGTDLMKLTSAGNLTINGTQTLTGNTTLSGTVAITGAATLSSTLAVTGASTLSGAITYKRNVIDTGGVFATPIVLTEAQSGSVILVDDAAGLDFTLPALAAAQIGIHYKFLVVTTITSNSFRVTAATGDLLRGGLLFMDFDAVVTAPQGIFLEPDESDDLIMSMNGTTTGGKKGTVVDLIGIHATGWFVSGTVAGDGAMATPFA